MDKKRDTMASLKSKVDNSNEDQIRRDEDFSSVTRVQLPNFQFSAYLIYSDLTYFELCAY